MEDEHQTGSDLRGPAKWLTVPGRLLLILVIAGCGAAFYFFFLGTIYELPAGSYPILFWVAPVGIGGGIAFLFVAFVLERLGVRIYRMRRGNAKS